MLTSLIRNPPATDESPQEILDNTSLTIFYPDAQRTFHGDPGSAIIYASKRYGDITLRLADPAVHDERWLFAHHLWNSSVLLAELISDEAARVEGENKGQRDVVAEGRAEIGQDVNPGKGVHRADQQDNRQDLGLRAPGRWSVKGERVLELGAGA